MKSKSKNPEYDRFDDPMRELLKVPRSEFKDKPEAEKKTKKANNCKRARKTGKNYHLLLSVENQ
jgi:hypothetical protein